MTSKEAALLARLREAWLKLIRVKNERRTPQGICDFDDQPMHPVSRAKAEAHRWYFEVHDRGLDPIAEILKIS